MKTRKGYTNIYEVKMSNEISELNSNFKNRMLTHQYRTNNLKACFTFFEPSKKETTKDYYQTKGEELHNKWTKMCPKISLEFFEEITAMAERLNFDSDDLCAIMFRESGFKPNAHGKNSKTGVDYYGLIQMDKTSFTTVVAHALKTEGKDCKLDPNMTYEKYAKLPREKQLKYSEAYIKFRIDEKGLTGKKLTGGQLWTLINSPKNINNPKFVTRNQARIDKVHKLLTKYDDKPQFNQKS